MSKIVFTLTLVFLCLATLHARSNSKFKTLSHSKSKTGSYSTTTKILDEFGVNQGWDTFNLHPRILADIDGDGLKDLVGFQLGNQRVAFADGNGGFKAPVYFYAGFGGPGWNYKYYPVTACDVNGDGKDDLVGFGRSKVFVSLSKGTSVNFAVQLESDLVYDKIQNTQDRNPRFCYDVDGDGKADLVGFFDDGVYVEFSDGTSFAPKKKVSSNFGHDSGWTSFNLYPRCLGKIHNGCGSDIIGFAKDGVYVSAFNGENYEDPHLMLPGQYGTLAGGWHSQNQYPRMCVDMNGDGKTDIVAYGISSFITYAKSDGTLGATSYQEGESTNEMVSGFPSFDVTPRLAGVIRSNTKYGSLIGIKDDGVYVSHKN